MILGENIIKQNTHHKINKSLSGNPIELKEGYSKVKLKTTSDMITDDTGLIHGGFTFSLADFAAMLAVNHPNVVLGGANVNFLKPVVEGDIIIAEAQVVNPKEKKLVVEVNVKKDDESVFSGEFYCFVPKYHVLKREG